MTFPDVPAPADTARHFVNALQKSEVIEEPYRVWTMRDTLPIDLAVGVLCLPVRPPLIDECGGVRDFGDNNNKRYFFTPQEQENFPAVKAFVDAFQRPEVARQFAETCGIDRQRVEGSFLRIEYIQDTDGAWLEPHRDVPDKIFSMVIYLCTGPEAKNWGTDIYDHDKKWLRRSSAEFNRAAIFISGPHSWHGFDKRPINGVRRLMEVNYVTPRWRDRWQLCLPDQPITLG